jgi:hypothetical protein
MSTSCVGLNLNVPIRHTHTQKEPDQRSDNYLQENKYNLTDILREINDYVMLFGPFDQPDDE